MKSNLFAKYGIIKRYYKSIILLIVVCRIILLSIVYNCLYYVIKYLYDIQNVVFMVTIVNFNITNTLFSLNDRSHGPYICILGDKNFITFGENTHYFDPFSVDYSTHKMGPCYLCQLGHSYDYTPTCSSLNKILDFTCKFIRIVTK